MSTFELKTHQIGRTYSKPHFFILNKGLNSGKSMYEACPNCFVVITSTNEDKKMLFHLSMMLQIGGFYAYYLKGSVIPFISIDDCRNTLKNALKLSANNGFKIAKHIKAVSIINEKENELQNVIEKLAVLKVSYIKSCFNLEQLDIE